MKPAIVPLFCGLILTAVSAAGISHWWSVHEMIALSAAGAPFAPTLPPAPSPTAKPEPAPDLAKKIEPPAPAITPVPSPGPVPAPSPAATAASEEFYRSLIAEMNTLRNQNRDLRDQVAETNRDLMKLEFRVDTHSESFRPLPVSEDRPDTTFDQSEGVLPPLDPVALPVH